MDIVRHYHATWIEAAERGEIEWEIVPRLIEAFELGVSECVEELTITSKSAPQIANEAIQVKNDTFQYLINNSKEISYLPIGVNNMPRIKEIEKKLQLTVNFVSRRLYSN